MSETQSGFKVEYPYQTRRESGEIRYFESFDSALEDGKHKEVWKISFATGKDRVRLIKNFDRVDTENYFWMYENVFGGRTTSSRVKTFPGYEVNEE